MAKKQSPKRTVASFLSDRLKQQVAENYDYLEENTRRVHSGDTEVLSSDYVRDSRKEKVAIADSQHDIEKTSRALRGAVADFSPEDLGDYDSQAQIGSEAKDLVLPFTSLKADDTEGASEFSSLTNLLQDPELSVKVSPVSPQIAEAAESIKIAGKSDEEVFSESIDQNLNLAFDADARIFEKIPDVFETQASTFVNLISTEMESMKSSMSQVKAPASLDSDNDFSSAVPLPGEMFELMVRGGLSLRGIQIYLAMLSAAGFKKGGIATLSYSDIATLTTIQTPHIPGILKSLVEMKLVAKFRAEKTASTKNSYTIL